MNMIVLVLATQSVFGLDPLPILALCSSGLFFFTVDYLLDNNVKK